MLLLTFVNEPRMGHLTLCSLPRPLSLHSDPRPPPQLHPPLLHHGCRAARPVPRRTARRASLAEGGWFAEARTGRADVPAGALRVLDVRVPRVLVQARARAYRRPQTRGEPPRSSRSSSPTTGAGSTPCTSPPRSTRSPRSWAPTTTVATRRRRSSSRPLLKALESNVRDMPTRAVHQRLDPRHPSSARGRPRAPRPRRRGRARRETRGARRRRRADGRRVGRVVVRDARRRRVPDGYGTLRPRSSTR